MIPSGGAPHGPRDGGGRGARGGSGGGFWAGVACTAKARSSPEGTHRRPAGNGGIVLSGHTDVVPVADQNWATDPFRLHERDGRLFGRGTCDMKGFVAAIMATAPDWSGAPLRRPLHLALTHDEEVGCLGACPSPAPFGCLRGEDTGA